MQYRAITQRHLVVSAGRAHGATDPTHPACIIGLGGLGMGGLCGSSTDGGSNLQPGWKSADMETDGGGRLSS